MLVGWNRPHCRTMYKTWPSKDKKKRLLPLILRIKKIAVGSFVGIVMMNSARVAHKTRQSR
ncbi:hypothetical protein CGZ75_16330 [Paenibacillus herberti]|uniref:Uncharacterized protein n=1 Tax=Paenibacillus herberti TaxID=1619309 RepID=A0A229NXG0_9BACL|nr:hypothetical protein CGZ75_16330 [Paenibacillus herberti]